jgi:hypothetical protein
LSQLLSNFSRRRADHRILIGIVSRISSKDRRPDGAFFDVIEGKL